MEEMRKSEEDGIWKAAESGDWGYLLHYWGRGGDLNVRMAEPDGRTPLHVAAAGGKVWFVRHAVYYGAEVDEKDGLGRTPLFHAVRTRDVEMVALLCLLDADPNVKNRRGKSPLKLYADDSENFPPEIGKSLTDAVGRFSEAGRFDATIKGWLAKTELEKIAPALKFLGVKTMEDLKGIEVNEIKKHVELNVIEVVLLNRHLRDLEKDVEIPFPPSDMSTKETAVPPSPMPSRSEVEVQRAEGDPSPTEELNEKLRINFEQIRSIFGPGVDTTPRDSSASRMSKKHEDEEKKGEDESKDKRR